MCALSTLSTIAQSNLHDLSFETIEGETVSFSTFSGKKVLIVNTASECGFTPQYEALQALHEKHGNDLVIVGFPANNFGGQEPRENSEIASFCQKNYGVTFLMAAKISVVGKDIHPIFKWLCEQENEAFTGAINWNFEKFLLNEQGELVSRFRSSVKPDSKKILDHLSQ